MKIKLTQNKIAIIDDSDYEKVKDHKWWAIKANKGVFYAVGKKLGKRVWMHRILGNTPKGMFTDHINGDGLDNRKCNLRVATHSLNMRNKALSKNNDTGKTGVSFRKRKGHGQFYTAKIFINGKSIEKQFTFGKKKDKSHAFEEACAWRKYYENLLNITPRNEYATK